MSHAIIRTANGRRYEVDFEDTEITLEIFVTDDVVEIAVEAPRDLAPFDKRRFALLHVPSNLFNKALGEAAKRSSGGKQAGPVGRD